MKETYRTLHVCLVAILVVVTVFTSGCTPDTATTTKTVTATFIPGNTIPNQIAEGITANEAYNMIQANLDNPEFVILDIRTPEERAVSYLEDSVLLDWNGGVFASVVELLDRHKTYLLY